MSRTTPERQSERSAWLERAESLHDVLSEHADESTQLRTLSETSVRALEAADIFAMAAPLEVGGHDVHPATQVEVFERLAVADVSSGWVAMIQSETAGVVGAHIADGAGLDAVFGDGFPRIAGTANPEGRARLDDNGHSLHGRWSFASGIRHCEWVLANAVVENAAPPSDTERAIPRVVGSIVPIGSVAIEDSWHVMGLEGTGSNHYQIDDVFVPNAFALPFGGRHIERGRAVVRAAHDHLPQPRTHRHRARLGEASAGADRRPRVARAIRLNRANRGSRRVPARLRRGVPVATKQPAPTRWRCLTARWRSASAVSRSPRPTTPGFAPW